MLLPEEIDTGPCWVEKLCWRFTLVCTALVIGHEIWLRL